MLRATSLRLPAFVVLVFLLGLVICAFLAYFVLALVQVTRVVYEVFGMGVYG